MRSLGCQLSILWNPFLSFGCLFYDILEREFHSYDTLYLPAWLLTATHIYLQWSSQTESFGEFHLSRGLAPEREVHVPAVLILLQTKGVAYTQRKETYFKLYICLYKSLSA